MKKILKVLIVVVMISLIMTTAAFAKPGKGNPKGTVTAIDQSTETMTIMTDDNQALVIKLPPDFDYESVKVEDYVVAKGTWINDNTGFEAEWVKLGEPDDGTSGDITADTTGDDSAGNGNAWGQGGVYCAEGGKDTPHPVAAKIAEQYGVDIGWVMEKACEGHGFGAVMLALQTQNAGEEGGLDVDALLAQRKGGKGWGQIWQENGITKNDKAADAPPGQLKKLEKTQDKDTGKPDEPGSNGNKDGDKDTGKPDDPGNSSNNGDKGNKDDGGSTDDDNDD